MARQPARVLEEGASQVPMEEEFRIDEFVCGLKKTMNTVVLKKQWTKKLKSTDFQNGLRRW